MSSEICRESEQERAVWKPVLGALGIASVFLTIVGSFVFSPEQSASPVQMIGLDKAPAGAPPLVAEPAPRNDDREPVAEQALVIEEAPFVESFVVSDRAPRVEQVPVAEEDPVVEPAPVAQQVLAAEETSVAELATKADEVIISVPTEDANSPPETASDVSVAEVRPEPDALSPHENHEEQPHTVAVAGLLVPVALEGLSHHDRKLLRKIAHLEKKKDRLIRHDRSIVCR